jgi:hypothetical protein
LDREKSAMDRDNEREEMSPRTRARVQRDKGTEQVSGGNPNVDGGIGNVERGKANEIDG